MAHVAKYQASACGGMCAHYDREPERERGYRRENIDPARTALNYNLAPAREGGQVAFIKQRIASLGLKRAPRKDAVRMCDCVVTMPKTLDPARGREFFERAYGFLCERYGAANVVSAYVHMDETRPHMHFAWVPVTKDGRLSAKDVVSRKDLRTLHGDMQRSLEESMGCRVDVLLDPEQQGEKQLSHLGQAEYRAACDEAARATERAAAAEERADRAESAQRAAEDRLECLQRGVSDAESLAQAGLGEVRRVARESGWSGERERRAREENQRLRARAEALEGEGRELGGRIEALEGEQAGAPGELERLGEQVGRARLEVQRLGEREGRLGREVEGLGDRVRGLERRAAQLRELLEGARARLEDLGRRMARLLSARPALVRYLSRPSAELLGSWGMLPGTRRAVPESTVISDSGFARDDLSPDDLIRGAREDVERESPQPQRRRGGGRAR